MRIHTRDRPRSWLFLFAVLALLAILFVPRPGEPAELSLDAPAVLVDVGHEAVAFAAQVVDVAATSVVAVSETNQLNVLAIVIAAVVIAGLALALSRTFGDGASRYGPERRHRLDHYANRRFPAALGGARPILA